MRPRKMKYAKVYKGIYMYRLKELKCMDMDVGVVGLKSLEGGRVGNKVMETVRKGIRREVKSRGRKRRGKVFIKFFPSKGLTKKAVAVRMGKGKGNVDKWVGEVKCGKILYEVKGGSLRRSKRVLKFFGKRLPLANKLVVYRI